MSRTPKERLDEQKDELLSLQSIFGDDLISYKTTNCWKQPCPLEVTIRIKPQSVIKEAFVSMDMEIICGEEYPDKPPTIHFRNVIEFSPKDAEKLEGLLVEKANELVGMVAQNFLSMRNRKPVFSEHEKMLDKHVKKEIEQRRLRVDSENREIAEIAEENERRRIEKLNREDEEGHERKARMRMLNFGELSDCEMVEMLDPHFGNGEKKRIYKLSKFKSTRSPIHKLATEWSAWDQTNQILVTEWSFEFTLGRKQHRKHSANIDFTAFEKRLELFAKVANQKLSALKTEDQQFFSSYLFVNLKRCAASTPTNFNCKLLVGQGVEPEDKCLAAKQVFETIKDSSSKFAPQLAAQIVCALKWLHGQGFDHGYLRPYSIWMTNKQIFRLSDYFLVPRILDLCDEFERLTSISADLAHTSPADDLSLQKRQSRDLFALGELLDSILGLEKASSNPKTAGGDNSNGEAADFIAFCESAKDVEQLIDHKYLVHDLTRPSNDISFESNQLPKKLAILLNSRLTKDFQVYQYLGKGGFGDVFLARNKLDDNDYAIKRIPLNPKSDRLNQKIKREAKLFSKLNHEHVVRYYAAWLESVSMADVDLAETTTTTITDNSRKPFSSSSSELFSPVKLRAVQKEANLKTLYEENIDENESVKFTSDELTSSAASTTTSSSSSSSSDGGRGGKFFRSTKADRPKNLMDFSFSRQLLPQNFETLFSQHSALHSKSTAGHSEFDVLFGDEEEDNGIGENVVLEKRRNVDSNGDEDREINAELRNTRNTAPKFQQILYIQMEYCKNSTLRSLIDCGRLYTDTSTIWRIFREILSGLQYIHHQNMIHRDIKPMNIFLDTNWSVKIGDFGLATRDFFGQDSDSNVGEADKINGVNEKEDYHRVNKNILGSDAGFTKDVGTTMYIAPEIEGRSAISTKFYTSKIDVYSVGIVLFEMFYRPPSTASERFAVLQNLRAKVTFPEDFGAEITNHQRVTAKKLIIWMLKVNPVERPSIDALLQSEIIPLVEYEEDEFQKMFIQALRKRKNRLYKWMISTLFNQKDISPALTYCFDQTICLEQNRSIQHEATIAQIRHELERIFQLHAFVSISTHLLTPFNENTGSESLGVLSNSSNNNRSTTGGHQQQCALMDSSGLPLTLPTNLRQNFIRYCVRNAISRVKRYTFGKVYIQSDLSGGVHPVERNECCVDLVGQALLRHFLAAECVALSMDVVRRLSIFEDLKWTLVIGHSKLIKAACIQLNIGDESTQTKVFDTLYYFSTMNKRLTTERKCEFLVNRCGLTIQLASSLLRLLETTNDFSEFNDQLRSLTRSKSSSARELARDALDDISKTLSALRYFSGSGIKNENLLFDAGLCYRPHTFKDGLVYFVRVDVLHQGAFRAVTVLAGGAYESSINAERRAQDPTPPWPICAYGFNLALENLVQFCQLRNLEKIDVSPCSVLVCSTLEELIKAKYDLTQRLWELGISADVIHEPLTSVYNVLEYCQKNAIHMLLVLLKSDEVVVYADDLVSQVAANSVHHQQQPQQLQQKRSAALLGYRIAQNKISCDEAIRVALHFAIERFAAQPHAQSATNILQASGAGAKNALVAGLFSAFGLTGGHTPLTLAGVDFNATASSLGAESTQLTGIAQVPSFATVANVNVSFAMDEKPAHNFRKKIEIQIRNVLSGELLPKLASKTRVEVFVTELTPEIVRALAAHLERSYESAQHFSKAIETFQATHKVSGGRHKSELDTLAHALSPLFTQNSAGVGVEFSPGTSFPKSGEMSAIMGATSVGIGVSLMSTGGAASAQPIVVIWCKNMTQTSIFYRVIY